MKVAIVCPIEFGDHGHVGGGERYALELARALAALVDTRLVTFGRRRRTSRKGRLRVEIYPRGRLVRGRLNNPLNPLFLGALRDVDVIHCIGWHTLPTDLAVLFGRLTGKRVFVSDVGGGADVSLARIFPIGTLVHRFLFLSRYAASLYPQFAERSAVIYGGADLARFTPAEVPRERQVLFVGRIIQAKGIEHLIDAVDPNVPLVIIGRPYDAGYLAELRRRSDGRMVRFVADATDADVVDAYRRSLVTVLPSVGRPGAANPANVLGLVLLEAMACGTPVICTESGPEAELVEDGATGYVVAAGDPVALRSALSRFLADPGLSERLGHAARERVQADFTWERTAERCLKAYTEGGRG
jgi:glycosyltransferase involved in cell wall biosynthesis